MPGQHASSWRARGGECAVRQEHVESGQKDKPRLEAGLTVPDLPSDADDSSLDPIAALFGPLLPVCPAGFQPVEGFAQGELQSLNPKGAVRASSQRALV